MQYSFIIDNSQSGVYHFSEGNTFFFHKDIPGIQ